VSEWTDRHETLVAEADPARESEPADYDRVWARVSAAMAVSGPPRRRRRTVFAGVVIAALVGVGGAAAAGVLSSRTGEYDHDQEDRVLGGPGERLNPQGDDFRAVVAEETADIPFPSAAARRISLDFQVADLGRDSGDEKVLTSTSAVAGFVANDAICSWANEWARATDAGDSGAVSEATGVLDTASTWPAVTTLQDLDSDRFGWLAGVERAAHGASVSALGAGLAGNVMCLRELVPDLPEALPVGLPPCAATADPQLCLQQQGSSTGEEH
jgi:hypothetical protein